MSQKLILLALAAALLGACDTEDSKPNYVIRSSSAPNYTASSAPSTSSNTTTRTPSKSNKTVSVKPEPEEEEDPEVEPIKVQEPQGVIFVRAEDWQALEPNWDMLKGMDHAENQPIMDLVIMHTAMLTTEDDELKLLRQIQQDHMNKAIGRGWGDIAAHYLIGPSGKVYQGRRIQYRYPTPSVGGGMGRFNYAWEKCAIMLLGNFNDPNQEFTEAAKEALLTLIDDRQRKFGDLYRDILNAREAEAKILLGSTYQGQHLGLDEVRLRYHPSLPPLVRNFLDHPEKGPPEIKPQLRVPRLPLKVQDAGVAGDAGVENLQE